MPSFGALRFPDFNPAMATITAITKDRFAKVTTAFAHTFGLGQYITFMIPPEYGMSQINGLTGVIVAIPTSSSFLVDIDTNAFDMFVVPVAPTQSAQALPSGELATTYLNATKNVLPYP